jgi:hypothetical protein
MSEIFGKAAFAFRLGGLDPVIVPHVGKYPLSCRYPWGFVNSTENKGDLFDSNLFLHSRSLHG